MYYYCTYSFPTLGTNNATNAVRGILPMTTNALLSLVSVFCVPI